MIYQKYSIIFYKRNFLKYSPVFENMTPEQAHKFISSTRNENSENYDFDNDRIYTCLRFLGLDETTDNFTSFIFFIGETLYITYEFWRKTHHDKEQIGKVNWFAHEEKEVFKVLKEAIRCMS